jgi:hypothetical protein
MRVNRWASGSVAVIAALLLGCESADPPHTITATQEPRATAVMPRSRPDSAVFIPGRREANDVGIGDNTSGDYFTLNMTDGYIYDRITT